MGDLIMNEYPDKRTENGEDTALPETGTMHEADNAEAPAPQGADHAQEEPSAADFSASSNGQPIKADAGSSPEGAFRAVPEENSGYTPGGTPSQNPYAGQSPYGQDQSSYSQEQNPYGQQAPERPVSQYSPMPQYPPQYTPYKVSGTDGGKPPKKKGSYWIIGVLVCVIVVCLCVGTAALLNNRNNAKNPTGGSGSPTAQDTTSSIDLNVKPTPSQEEMLSTADAVKKAAPSVVGVVAYANANSGAASSGSGIILSSDGYIVTNHHVVEGYTNSLIKVVLSNGDTYEAKYIASDSYSDIAVLKIDASNLTAAEIGNSDDLAPGQFVVAIGNPGGLTLQGTSTFGMVSAVDRSITVNGITMKCIQTDAAINPGNSGGALINLYGQVVGINSAKLIESGYEGIGFSIPINTAKPIIDQLIATGKSPSRPFLGITYSEVDEMQAKYYNIPQGIRIESIYDQSSLKGTQAEVGDIIIEADGQKITSKQVFLDLINSKKTGDSMSLKLYRPNYGNGKTFEVTVTLISNTDITEQEQQQTTQPQGNSGGNNQYRDFQDFLDQFGW